ncbi:MAG: GNAT family N-acetyltransferase [Pseudomonadota bacterium]
MTSPAITPTTAEDTPAIQSIVDQTGLFPADLVPDLLDPFLTEQTTEFWRTARIGQEIVGFAYIVPEMLAEGTWTLTAIAIALAHQRSGTGSVLLNAVENHLRTLHQRILLVDTSSTEDFEMARGFYIRNGYNEEARIRDFWAEGDDKVVFRKAL